VVGLSVTPDPVWMEEIAKYHTIKPQNLKHGNYKKRPLSRGDINTHNLNITGEEMTLGKVPIFKMLS
jgi:hypothetical protein